MDLLKSGKVDEFLQKLRADKERFKDETEESWYDAENEAFLANEVLELHDAEIITYNILRDFQGQKIPRLLANITLNISPINSSAIPTIASELYHIKGLLLKYLSRFSL